MKRRTLRSMHSQLPLLVLFAASCGTPDESPTARAKRGEPSGTSGDTQGGATQETMAGSQPGASGAAAGQRTTALAEGAGTVATVLNTYSQVWVDANARGPNRIGQNTGAGAMDADVFFRVLPNKNVLLGVVYTRSAQNANNEGSYLQGGAALALLTDKGVQYGKPFDLPNLNNERAFMRPLIAIDEKGERALLIAASEDNGRNNNNPLPVAFLTKINTDLSLSLQAIANENRNGNINKPTNLISLAVDKGINVQNPDDQRGPHTLVQTGPDTFAVGMQYNNQAHEGFSLTLTADNSIDMKWLRRYSNNAQHCRPAVTFDAATNTLFSVAVEADTQPAEIGWRMVAINPETGQALPNLNKVVVRSDPGKNRYVSEPSCGMVADKVACGWGMTSKARNRDGANGHAGGGQVPQLALFDPKTLTMIGEPISGGSPYGRHSHVYATLYGPDATPAAAFIGGSSTGTGPGKSLLYPLTADGKLGVKDFGKMYTVSLFSDVANLQARGKRNPNNQAKGFINGEGPVPNPGYESAAGFMPEVKSFSLSVVTGYSDEAAKTRGLKESVWLSLVPAQWKPNIQTVPGQPTPTPGTNPDGTGPLPQTKTTTPTNPAGDQTSGVADPGNPDEQAPGVAQGSDRPSLGGEASGCSVTQAPPSAGWAGFVAFAFGGAILLRRRAKKSEEIG